MQPFGYTLARMPRQRVLIAAGALLLLLLGFVVVRQFGQRVDVRPIAMPTIESAPKLGIHVPNETPQRERFIGVVLAHEAVDMTPRYEGKIRELHVRLGDLVPEKGLIASLDTKTIGYDLTMADAAAKAAEAERKKVVVELDEAIERHNRRKALAAESVASAEDVSTAGYQVQLARAQLELVTAQVAEKKARVEQLRQQRADADLRAPFEGIVAARYVDAGANVNATTHIVRLISAKPPFVRFAVPGTSPTKLEKGQEVLVEVEGTAETISGKIDTIAPEIDAASRMIIVEATLVRPDDTHPFRSGAVAHVKLAEERH